MNNTRYTVIHFDYGGYYSKNGDDESSRWVSKEDEIYTVVMKTSMEEVTYSELADRICRKIGIDKAIAKPKFSYIPLVVEPKRPSYIVDDEDVFGYLMEVNKDQCRSVLHVELIEDIEQIQNCELSRYGVDVRTDDAPTSLSREEVSNSSHRQDLEELSNDRADSRVDDVINDISEDVELTPNVQENQDLDHAWEDGIDLVLGQEFGNKQAVQDLVEKAALHNCFEVATMKSCTTLYVVKCHQFKTGCKWALRVAKLKKSDSFSVRTYNKIHTCSRVNASTSKNRSKCTPKVVASILHEDYPGLLNTPSPKNLIDLVQEKLGVKISYATALRGKKQAANDVRGSP